MPLDHFVSQVHLKQFTSSSRGGRQLLCIRKADLHKFPCNPKDVCRVEAGSTNTYLSYDRAIEEFLKSIEPQYNVSLDRIRSGSIDEEAAHVIAGFIAYIKTCSPTAMRLLSKPLKTILESTARMAEQRVALPTSPEELGGKTLTELIDEGIVQFDVDEKFPQAIGISQILDITETIKNGDWDIIINPYPEMPFFTSDYPVGVSYTRNIRVADHLVPLSPDLAVRIHPNIDRNATLQQTLPSTFRYRYINSSQKDVRRINQTIARCSERLIFYPLENKWITPFISKNSMYALDHRIDNIPTGRGHVSIYRLCIIDTSSM